MLSYITDFRHAARTLIRARAFTAVCVTSLGLGMGVVILILLFMRMILSTPPGVNDDGLVELVIRPSGELRARAGGAIIETWSFPDYLDVRSATGMVITGWSPDEALFQPADGGAAAQVPTMFVSSNYFSTIDVPLWRGQGFTAADDAARTEPEAVISHRAWQVRFGSDPNIIGRPITVNGTEFVIVGVGPEEFRGHVAGLDEPYIQMWLPLTHHPRLAGAESARFQRDADLVRIVARLTAEHDGRAGERGRAIGHGGAGGAASRDQQGESRRRRTLLPGRRTHAAAGGDARA